MVSLLFMALIIGFATTLIEKTSVQVAGFGLVALLAALYHPAMPGVPSTIVLETTAGFFFVFGASLAAAVHLLAPRGRS